MVGYPRNVVDSCLLRRKYGVDSGQWTLVFRGAVCWCWRKCGQMEGLGKVPIAENAFSSADPYVTQKKKIPSPSQSKRLSNFDSR